MSTSMQDSRRIGRRSVDEMAAELGLQKTTLIKRMRRLNLRATYAHGKRGGAKYIPLAAEPVLRASYSERADPAAVEGWPTSREAARMLQISTRVFNARIADGRLQVERRQISRPGVSRRIYVYSLPDLRRAAAAVPVLPRSVPRGALSINDLAMLLGIDGNAIRGWKGCPDGWTMRGWRYYYPAQVLGWLRARPQPVKPSNRVLRARHEERLTLWIKENA